MNTLTKVKAYITQKKAAIATGVTAALTATPFVAAEAAIANDTLEGLPEVGSDLGDFLKNLAPGIGAFILIMGVFVGIVYIVVSIGKYVGKMAGKGGK